MGKNNKGREVSVKRAAKEPAAPRAARLPSWEEEIERMLDELPFVRLPRLFRDLEPFRFQRELRMHAPSIDMYEEKDELVVKAELPGMSKDDFEVVLSDSTLTIKGEKKKEEETKEKDYYRCEREYGSFLRTIRLPTAVNTEGAKAEFKQGVLEIRLPKSERSKEVHVAVE